MIYKETLTQASLRMKLGYLTYGFVPFFASSNAANIVQAHHCLCLKDTVTAANVVRSLVSFNGL